MLTPELAKQIIDLRVNDDTQRRIDTLADKCNEGELTPDEQTEYESYVAFFNYMTLLQAKARTYLKNNPGGEE
ncbi:MAG: hypothetical protein AB7G28_22010 [Pirellulales bacterium]